MKKRTVLLEVFLSLILINLTFISAGIYFSQPESTYNLGDMIVMDVSVDPIYEDHLLQVILVCEGDDVLEFNNLPDEGGNVEIRVPLSYYTIKEVSGECYFSGNYADDSDIRSNDFEISRRLNVKLDSDSFYAKPGEEVDISGIAERLNGVGIEGEVEISIPLLSLLEQANPNLDSENDSEQIDEDVNESVDDGNDSAEGSGDNEDENQDYDAGKFYGRVIDGDFSVNFVLDDDTPAGEYRIDVVAYEKSGDVKTSEGIAMASLTVFQILTEADVAFSSQNLNPGESFSFNPILSDQTGEPIYDEVSVIIKSEDQSRVYEKILQSEETAEYKIPTNLPAGYYEIEVSSGEVSSIKKFYVNEKAIVSFNLDNATLTVTNIGNIPYNKDIQIELNGKPFVKELELGLNESKSFKLTGEDGEYNIIVSDGESEISDSGILLTGRAVGVQELNEEGSFSLVPVFWVFLIIIIIGVILFLFRKIFKKKSFAYPLKGKIFKKKSIPSETTNTKIIKMDSSGNLIEGDIKDKEEPSKGVVPTQAEQVLVLKGQKSKVALIVLKIKNKINKTSKESLEKSIDPVFEKKGVVYEQGDYIFIIFSPLVTKSFKNEVEAAKVSERIVKVLQEHNKKMKDKIEFGIAINSGEMINRIEDDKLKFTALGNLIISGKRLAEASDEHVLVTKEAYEAGISDIKAEKTKVKGTEVYKIEKIVDNERNQQFIRDFLKRQSQDNAGKK